MPSAEEKQRRKGIAQQLQNEANASLLATLPLSVGKLKNLFDYLDASLTDSECDDTLHYTEQFASETQVPFSTLKTWLGKLGGYCDCEVLANVEEKFEGLI